MSTDRRLDPPLVERARQGDGAALAELVGRLDPLLRSFFAARIGRRSEVDDLVQNTLLRVHRGLADLEDVRRLKAFTMKAAVFELQDFYRGRYSAKERLFDPESPPVTERVEPGEGERVDVERVLAVLNEKARAIIEMRELGYRYEEIARALGTTEAAVKMQVKRAFEKLREVFRDD